MPTAAHVVKKIVDSRPFLSEALGRGIINNAALAEHLQPEVEKELGKEVSFSAINMAIRRLADSLESKKVERSLFDSESDITTRSHLVEITIFKSDVKENHIDRIYDIVDLKKGDFLTMTQGLHEFMIITNRKHKERILEIFPKESVKQVIPNLSSITVHISDKSVETVGMFYTVTRALAWEDINIVDIVSTYTELTFIIRDEHMGRAVDILGGLIRKNLPS